jgi:hypothetical protein
MSARQVKGMSPWIETAYSYFFKEHFNIVFAVVTDTVVRKCASNLQADIDDPTRDYFLFF